MSLVWLNVSGTRFCATKSTLTQFPDSFFAQLVSRPSGSEDGSYFIGRSPLHFALVLEYLTGGSYELPPGVSRARMEEEMRYYGLSGTSHHAVDFKEMDAQLTHFLDASSEEACTWLDEIAYQKWLDSPCPDTRGKLSLRDAAREVAEELCVKLVEQLSKGRRSDFFVLFMSSNSTGSGALQKYHGYDPSRIIDVHYREDYKLFVLKAHDFFLRFCEREYGLTLVFDSGVFSGGYCFTQMSKSHYEPGWHPASDEPRLSFWEPVANFVSLDPHDSAQRKLLSGDSKVILWSGHGFAWFPPEK